jgi:membrane-associated protein
MSLVTSFIDIILHLDKHISWLLDKFGHTSYLILFIVIFMETGFVFTPFLPGDSLIFAVGTFAALGYFNIWLLLGLIALAAVLGDSVNYAVGHFIGMKLFEKERRFIKKHHLTKTQSFFDKHGGKTIIIARFVPIVRTFAPFLAGVGRMKYFKFLSYNILGGFLWVCAFLFAGYFFGNIPFIKNNFSLAILGVIIISMIPVIIELIKHHNENKKALKNKSL